MNIENLLICVLLMFVCLHCLLGNALNVSRFSQMDSHVTVMPLELMPLCDRLSDIVENMVLYDLCLLIL